MVFKRVRKFYRKKFLDKPIAYLMPAFHMKGVLTEVGFLPYLSDIFQFIVYIPRVISQYFIGSLF